MLRCSSIPGEMNDCALGADADGEEDIDEDEGMYAY